MTAVFPGSFDPITYGHLDIINRSSKFVDKLIVAVLHNSEKKGLFTIEERVIQAKEVTKNLANVNVTSFKGLLADFLKEQEINLIVKGVRSVGDYEYELRNALINKKLLNSVETIFLPTDDKYLYLSSTVVREIASYGGNIKDMVPPFIENSLVEIYNRRM